MGLLGRHAALALSGLASCYAPDVRDCTVKCSGGDDCAGDQTCNSDGYCVSSRDTRCMSGMPTPPGGGGGGGSSSGTRPDASLAVEPDAGAIPTDAPPDTATEGSISLRIEGKGTVQIEGVGSCASTCDYRVPLQVSLTMHAYPADDQRFDKWLTTACADPKDATCTFVPAVVMDLGARFRKAK